MNILRAVREALERPERSAVSSISLETDAHGTTLEVSVYCAVDCWPDLVHGSVGQVEIARGHHPLTDAECRAVAVAVKMHAGEAALISGGPLMRIGGVMMDLDLAVIEVEEEG